jgi:hypothetical protein
MSHKYVYPFFYQLMKQQVLGTWFKTHIPTHPPTSKNYYLSLKYKWVRERLHQFNYLATEVFLQSLLLNHG